MDKLVAIEGLETLLTARDRWHLRQVCHRWHFTLPMLQLPGYQPANSPFNLESRRFRHKWKTFVKRRLLIWRTRMLANLPKGEKEATYQLKMKLCESTNTGKRPSFNDASARSGYIETKFNRCSNLPSLLLTSTLHPLRPKILCKDNHTMAMFGGGPGFDALGLLLLLEFTRCAPTVHLEALVYDNEPGWANAVDALQATLADSKHGDAMVPAATTSVRFKHCDITCGLDNPSNRDVKCDLSRTTLFVFSFVCVENYVLLKQHDFEFLRQVFTEAALSSVFVFTDSTHRLWPEIHGIAQSIPHVAFHVWTPFTRSCHYALVMEKIMSPVTAQQLNQFKQTNQEALAKLQVFAQHNAKQLQRQHQQHVDIDASPAPRHKDEPKSDA